jgi:hypothetical protein
MAGTDYVRGETCTSLSLSKQSGSHLTKNNNRNGMVPFISGMEFVKSVIRIDYHLAQGDGI